MARYELRMHENMVVSEVGPGWCPVFLDAYEEEFDGYTEVRQKWSDNRAGVDAGRLFKEPHDSLYDRESETPNLFWVEVPTGKTIEDVLKILNGLRTNKIVKVIE